MRVLRFRTPVVCQNGHQAFFYWEIDQKDPTEFMETKSLGVKKSEDCECSKFDLHEGWGRAGKDKQFTGKKDTLGNEIYEGAIVQIAMSQVIGVIAFRAGTWYISDDTSDTYVELFHTDCEVIGSTYLNKNLLER